MGFNESYQKIFSVVQDEISELNKELSNLFEDDTLLHSGIKDFLLLPSKRIRPVLSFLYLKAYGIEITREQIKLQTIVELIHNASLIHDDVIDNGNVRRAKKTINNIFDNRLAVIAGDYLLSLTLKKLLEFNSIEIIKIFSDAIESMCTGEIDQHYTRFQITNIDKYIEKSYKKTGALFEAAVKSSLIMAGENSDKAEFAKDFGIAFQIRDDMKSVTSDDITKENNDIAEGIYNAPVIFSGNSQDPMTGIEKTKSLLNNYIISAENKILKLEESPYKSAIIELLGILNNE